MKKIMQHALATAAFLLITTSLWAQNVQLHYDFGDGREYFTSTVEMFKPDDWGSSFFFIDMDYGLDGDMSLAYWEISRDIRLWEAPVSLHAEFDGGFGQFEAQPFNGAYPINNAWLAGPAFSWNAPDFSKGFTLQALYKYIKDKHDASFQLTAVWYAHFLDNKLSFTGFADFWREDFLFGEEETEYVFLSEPQLWYNLTENLSLGGEVELGFNFATNQGFKAMPTIGGKWTF